MTAYQRANMKECRAAAKIVRTAIARAFGKPLGRKGMTRQTWIDVATLYARGAARYALLAHPVELQPMLKQVATWLARSKEKKQSRNRSGQNAKTQEQMTTLLGDGSAAQCPIPSATHSVRMMVLSLDGLPSVEAFRTSTHLDQIRR